MAAYTCVLHAERYGSPGALLERAKLLWQTGKREAALTCLDEGLRVVSSTNNARNLVQTLAMLPPPGTSRKGGPSAAAPPSDNACAQQVPFMTILASFGLSVLYNLLLPL